MQRCRITAILKTDKENNKGHKAVYIRITANGKPSFISTGHYIPEKTWDKKNRCVREVHPDHAEINTAIDDKKKELLDTLIKGNVSGKTYTAKALKEETTIKATSSNIFTFADAYIKEVGHKRSPGTVEIWEKHLRKLEGYHGSRSLSFEDITPAYLNAFEKHLRSGGVDIIKGTGSNYRHAIMKTIRRLFNAAIKKKLIDCYPFSEYELPEYTPGDKAFFSLSDLDKWEAYYKKCQTKKHRQAIVYFLFGCYTGLRISDWYRFNRKEHLKDGYIRLRAKKNGEWVVLPIHRRLQRVLDLMKATPLTTNEKALVTVLLLLSKRAGINKNISSHSARKTFAVTMCLDRGISSETAAELMGITLQVFVNSYAKVTAEKIKKETDRAWKDL